MPQVRIENPTIGLPNRFWSRRVKRFDLDQVNEEPFERLRLTNHTADRGSDLPRLFSAGGPRSGRELGDSMHWHISQSR